MISTQQVFWLLKNPSMSLKPLLATPPSIHTLALRIMLPFIALRTIAIIIRSFVQHAPLSGFITGFGHAVLQAVMWWSLALMLPPLYRQFHHHISHAQGYLLSTILLIPLWLGGILYLFPDTSIIMLLWTRSTIFLIALIGLYYLNQALRILEFERNQRLMLLGLTSLSCLTIYFALFLFVGLGASLSLFVLHAIF